ncbi:MAG: DnaA/Hda family protein [Alphaproteobacteria bacterium]|nr:DnaA/Hda family protein [Alphaproteobacteria bacterium]
MQSVAIKQNMNVESIKQAIAARMDSAGFTAWILPLQFEIQNNCLNLVAHNQFAADYVRNSYKDVIENVAADFSLTANIVVKNANNNIVNQTANDNVVCEYVPETNSKKVNNIIGFDKFICSDDNMFTVAACKKMALGGASFSQLFICGASGSGKSLLAGCICAESDKRVVMMSGGQFVADFTRSLRDKTVFSFKDFCRNCDMFILDDVCALAGKNATTNEFVQLIMDLRDAGKSVVLTANVAPGALAGFDHHIKSLFASGLVVDVVAPNASIRRNMLVRSGIDSNVADELSKHIAADGHLVNGIINKIKTYEELMGCRVDMDIATRLLGNLLEKSKTPLSMVKSMCEKMCVSYDEICGNSRARRLVKARQMMMAVLKNVTNLSLTEIGNVCGGRDHATVVYALAQIENQKTSDLILNAEMEDLIKLCK